jgi:hypothetical protein
LWIESNNGLRLLAFPDTSVSAGFVREMVFHVVIEDTHASSFVREWYVVILHVVV